MLFCINNIKRNKIIKLDTVIMRAIWDGIQEEFTFKIII